MHASARTLVLAALLLSVLPACGGGESAPDAALSPVDATRPPDDDAFVVPQDAYASSVDAFSLDAPGAEAGSITGHVTRTAMPAAGGRGHLYIAVFTADPVLDRTGARNVANARVDDVDMSAPGARIPYVVTGIPPRAEPYFVTAFLDDNRTVDASDPSSAGPDRGDLVALDGLGSPRVTVPDTRPVTFDLVLNFNLPF
ncbi:MAG: hypothetical protein OHK0013_15680 [Sandaracinaceae bacterium]